MGKFRCLGIPAALFLLAADVSSAKPDKAILRPSAKPRSRGDSASTTSPQLSIKEGGQTSSERGKWIGKLLKIVVFVFVLVLSFAGAHYYSNTGPTVSDVGTPTVAGRNTWNTRIVSDVVLNKGLRKASATGRHGGSGAYLESAVEQQEREKHAILATAKKEFLKQCIVFSSPTNGVEEGARKEFHEILDHNIQKYGKRAVESPEDLAKAPNQKAQAPSHVAKEIREELSKSKSLEGASSMPSIDELFRRMEVREPTCGKGERHEEELLREIQDLLVVLKEVEVINGEIRLPESNVDRIKKSMMKLTKLEKQKQQEKKNN